jgi:hypothetical protein
VQICRLAYDYCIEVVWNPLGGRITGNVYYVKDTNPVKHPTKYLSRSGGYKVSCSHDLIILLSHHKSFREQVGYEVSFKSYSSDVGENFAKTGDLVKSTVKNLQNVINAGVSAFVGQRCCVSATGPYISLKFRYGR